MNALRRWHWPTRTGGRVTLALGLAGTALALGLAGTAMTSGLTDAAAARAVSTHHAFSAVALHEAVAWGGDSDPCVSLGNGTTTGSLQPTQVSGLGTNVAQVSAGGCHGLAVTGSGTVWAWGDDASGQLGNGTVSNTIATTPVQVPGLTGVTQVAAGFDHSLALRSDGTVWAWGDDTDGEIGNGTVSKVPQATPVQVPGLTNITKIAAGTYYSLALRSDGTVWAWGDNEYGQLGDGTTTSNPAPVQVVGLAQATNIAAGERSVLATRVSGLLGETTVWAWGSNSNGQLGDGTFTNHDAPELVQGIGIPLSSGVAGIAAGNDFSLVLGGNGSLWGWGYNGAGDLGTVDSGQITVTQPVEEIAPGSGYTQISAGGAAYVVAVRSDGTAWTWGSNVYGQLGDGTTTGSPGPVQVTGLTNVTQVSAGGDFALAVHTVPLRFRL